MKTDRRILIAILLIAALALVPGAMAESISFTGMVEAGETCEIYAPIGGNAEKVYVQAGQRVEAGDVLVKLSTTKVYAEEAGTVTAVFGQPGDTVDAVTNTYGAVMYLEGEIVYTISASTDKAYNSEEMKFVHAGEDVFLSCSSDGSHTGTGVITAISGNSYTVKVLTGEFLLGESVNIYRGSEVSASMRIGRGNISRINPTAITGSGSIVSFAVSAGQKVERGDLLFETLDGTFEGLYMSGSEIVSSVSGIVSQVSASQGSTVQQGSVAAVVYPDSAMRIAGQIDECNLAYVSVGMPVTIELSWNEDQEVTYTGTISMISAIADSGTASTDGESLATYTVYVDFTPDENTRYGMSAVVTTVDDEDDDLAAEEEAPADISAEAEETGAAPDGFDPANMPDGFDPANMPNGFDPNSMPEGFDLSNIPEGFAPGGMPGSGN